jgi:hypothetical protein
MADTLLSANDDKQDQESDRDWRDHVERAKAAREAAARRVRERESQSPKTQWVSTETHSRS